MTQFKGTVSQSEFKITILKLIEIAYSEKKGVTTSLLLKSGNAKLTVKDNGECVLSGKVGIVTFSGKDVIEELGVQIKGISVSFKASSEGNVAYTGVITWGFIKLSIKGGFNLKEYLLSCSNPICKAAQFYRGGPDRIERALRNQERGTL